MQLQFQKNSMILLQIKYKMRGLGEKVDVQFKDYREINNKYSNIASIEMFEAVGKKYWQSTLILLRNSLSPKMARQHYK